MRIPHRTAALSSLTALSMVPVLSLLAPSAAHAHVTLYGTVDAGLHFKTNADGQGHSALTLGNTLSSNRLGFKGEEDLGGGTKVVMQLEAGFSSDTGALGAQSPGAGHPNLFGRQSYVGIEGGMGSLTLGRQYNALAPFEDYQLVSDHLYLGGGHFFNGYRANNSLVYKKTIGPLSLQLDAGLGEQAGHHTRKSALGGNLIYTQNGFSGIVSYLQNRSPDGATTGRFYNLGTSYAFTPTLTLSAGYARSLVKGAVARNRHITFVSSRFIMSPAWSVYGSLYRYRQSACGGMCEQRPGDPGNASGGYDTGFSGYGIARDSGNAHMAALTTTYALSRRTSLYAKTDWLLARDGAARDHHFAFVGRNDAGGRSLSQTHVAVGMRHRF